MSDEKTPVRKFELSYFGIVIEVFDDGAGAIHTPLTDDRPEEWEDDPFHVAVDTVLSLALFHACAGIDVSDSAYEKGLEAALMAISSRWADDD